jgi:predicted Zn-dependent protease
MDRLSLIQQMLEQDPDDAFMMYAASLELRKLGDLQKAVDTCYKITTSHPNYLPVYYQLAEMLLQQGNPDEATRIAHQGIAVAKQQNDHKTAQELEFLVEG